MGKTCGRSLAWGGEGVWRGFNPERGSNPIVGGGGGDFTSSIKTREAGTMAGSG